MTDADHCMTAVKVQILLTFFIPHFLALSLYDVYREQAIYWKKIHLYFKMRFCSFSAAGGRHVYGVN